MNIQYVNKHLLVPNGRPRHFELRRGQSFGLDSYYIRCKQSVIKQKKKPYHKSNYNKMVFSDHGEKMRGNRGL